MDNVPWQDETPETKHIHDLLRVYLAMGWAPQETSGEGLLCGANALATSLRAQQDLTAGGIPISASASWTPAQIADIIDSSRYTELVLQEMFMLGAEDSTAARGLANEMGSFQRNNFDINQLRFFLRILNEYLGTRYSLGLIYLGYVNGDYELPTRIDLLDVGQGLRGGVVWLCHMHLDDEQGHWEGLSPQAIDDDDGDREDVLVHLLRNLSVESLLPEAKAQQLSIVMADYNHNSPENELEVYKGCIVDGSKKELNNVPDGYVNKTLLHEKTTGLVLKTRLQSVALLFNEDSEYENIEQDTDSSINKGETMKFEVFRVIHETSKVCGPKDPYEILDDFGYDISPSQVTPVAFHLDLGNHKPGEGCFIRDIEGYEFSVHNRILQKIMCCPWGQPNLPHWSFVDVKPEERDIDTTEFQAAYSKMTVAVLQSLVSRRELEVVARAGKTPADKKKKKRPVKADYIEALLKDEVKRAKIEAEAEAKAELVARRKEALKKRGFLPMFRVLQQIEIRDDDGRLLRFYGDEIVLLVGDGIIEVNGKAVAPTGVDPYSLALVVDYEGRFGRIPRDILDPINKPWELDIDMSIFGRRLELLRSVSIQKEIDRAKELFAAQRVADDVSGKRKRGVSEETEGGNKRRK